MVTMRIFRPVLRHVTYTTCTQKFALPALLRMCSRHQSTNNKITHSGADELHASSLPSYKNIVVEICGAKKNVGLITFNRPKVLNVFSSALIQELFQAVDNFKNDRSIAAVVFTGSTAVFTAGGDIKLMQQVKDFSDAWSSGKLDGWDNVAQMPKPMIAACNGLTIGFGSELSLMCDIIYAGENAEFGLPEISIGTIPGAGGTERLVRAIGKSKAMEMVLTGNRISAVEAEKAGLVSKVFPVEQTVPEAIKLAEKIGSMSKIAVQMCKESVNNAFEMTLREGCHFEKRLFHATFATKDRAEGMLAFIEKREPKFVDG